MKRPSETTVAIVILGLVVAAFWLLSTYEPKPEPQTSSTQTPADRGCDFVVKTTGEDFHISEPQAGTYKYELYAGADGVEVWKCN